MFDLHDIVLRSVWIHIRILIPDENVVIQNAFQIYRL